MASELDAMIDLLASTRGVNVRVDGTSMRLRVADVGPSDTAAAPADGPALPLLVIPGHTARIDGFVEMVSVLGERRRVIVVDLPACGDSDRPVRRYDLRFYEDSLVAVLDALGIDRAVPVGGSLGGHLSLRLGHRWPQRFPELVVWAPGGAWQARPWLASLTRLIGSRATFWPSVWIQSRFWYRKDFAGRDAALAETFGYYRESMSPGFVNMYWGLAADQIAHSLFDIAPGIEQRTLLMWGDQDHGAGMGRGVARLRGLLPQVTYLEFAGARHSLETEIPTQLADAVLAFLDPSPSSSPPVASA